MELEEGAIVLLIGSGIAFGLSLLVALTILLNIRRRA